eukprot:31144-Pelagococcus_subviridis.AAC.8
MRLRFYELLPPVVHGHRDLLAVVVDPVQDAPLVDDQHGQVLHDVGQVVDGFQNLHNLLVAFEGHRLAPVHPLQLHVREPHVLILRGLVPPSPPATPTPTPSRGVDEPEDVVHAPRARAAVLLRLEPREVTPLHLSKLHRQRLELHRELPLHVLHDRRVLARRAHARGGQPLQTPFATFKKPRRVLRHHLDDVVVRASHLVERG